MLLSILTLALNFSWTNETPYRRPLPLVRGILTSRTEAVRSPYSTQPAAAAPAISPYVPVLPNAQGISPGSPYATIQHPKGIPAAEPLPAPQILEPPARWLPAIPVSRPNKPRTAPAPPIPQPMPLIPLDQVPEGLGSETPTIQRVTTYCLWQ